MISGNKFIVKQEVEPVEVLVHLETANKYSILDENEKQILFAYEKQGNFLAKQLFSSNRELELEIIDSNKKKLFSIKRYFFTFKSTAEVFDSNNELFGTMVQKKWFWKKRFDFILPNGETLFSCISKPPRVWTFRVFKDKEEIALISKKWSGLGKEMFTDSDNFAIDASKIEDEKTKLALIFMTLNIDLRLFEKSR